MKEDVDFEIQEIETMKKAIAFITLFIIAAPAVLWARDIDYKPGSGEIEVFVNLNEPTQIQFPGTISGGFKKKNSAVSLDKMGQDLVVFATQQVSSKGEAVIIRLNDGRSYSLRIKRASKSHPRDDFLAIYDKRGSIISGTDEELPAYKEKFHRYAPPTMVSGLMRELILVSELGKQGVPGYKRSDKYRGQVILDDGALEAKIESIFIGPALWGYVINASNRLNQTQKINPATFRLDGTRAISASNWELAPKPYNIEQQIAGKDKSKIYIITKARN